MPTHGELSKRTALHADIWRTQHSHCLACQHMANSANTLLCMPAYGELSKHTAHFMPTYGELSMHASLHADTTMENSACTLPYMPTYGEHCMHTALHADIWRTQHAHCPTCRHMRQSACTLPCYGELSMHTALHADTWGNQHAHCRHLGNQHAHCRLASSKPPVSIV